MLASIRTCGATPAKSHQELSGVGHQPFSALAEPQRRRRRAPSYRAVKQEVADAIRVQEKERAQTTTDAVEDLFLSRGLKMVRSPRPTVKLLLFRRR